MGLNTPQEPPLQKRRRSRNRNRTIGLALAVFGLAASWLAAETMPAHAQENRPLRIAVPAYIFSTDLRSWETLIEHANAIPVAVLNPRNGPWVYSGLKCDNFTPPVEPGTGPDLSKRRVDDPTFSTKVFPNDPVLISAQDNYKALLEQQFIRRAAALRKAGIEVFGYVWSNTNGADTSCPRSSDIIGEEIDRYKQIYGVTNVFLDDTSNQCPAPTRTSHVQLAKSKGAKVIVNPGFFSGPCLATEADIVVNFEGTPREYAERRFELEANAASLRNAQPNVKVWHIVYGADDAEIKNVIAQAKGAADYLYVTDDRATARGCDGGTSPFDSLLGTWPIIRGPEPACEPRANGNTTTFGEFVRLATGLVPTTATPISAGTSPPATTTPARSSATSNPTASNVVTTTPNINPSATSRTTKARKRPTSTKRLKQRTTKRSTTTKTKAR